MFGLFKKKESKKMALDQKEIEKLKGLSQEDKQALIEALSKEESEAPKGEEDTSGDNDDKDNDVEKEPEEEPEKDKKKEPEQNPDKGKQDKVEKKQEKQEKPDNHDKDEKDDTPSWAEDFKKTLKDVQKQNEALTEEIENLKKKRPAGFESKPTPKHDENDKKAKKAKKLTENKW